MSLTVGATIFAYMMTAAGAVILLERASNRRIRLLTCAVGLMPMCQALGLLRDHVGWVGPAMGNSVEMLQLAASCLSLASIHFLNRENRDRRSTDIRLRVAEFELPSQMTSQTRQDATDSSNRTSASASGSRSHAVEAFRAIGSVANSAAVVVPENAPMTRNESNVILNSKSTPPAGHEDVSGSLAKLADVTGTADRVSRFCVGTPASLQQLISQPQETKVDIVEISSDGLRIKTQEDVPLGTCVRVDSEKEMFLGWVVRCANVDNEREILIKLEHSLNLPRLEGILASLNCARHEFLPSTPANRSSDTTEGTMGTSAPYSVKAPSFV